MEFLKNAIEFQNFGFNIATVGFLGTMFFTILQGWSLFEQNKTIRHKKSGESLSIAFFMYTMCYFTTFFIYGLTKNSITMTFNGMLAIPYIPILFALKRFKGFNTIEKALLVLFSLMIPMAYLLRGTVAQDVFILVGLFGILVPLVDQIRVMLNTKSPGAVEPKFIITFILAGLFWFVFGLTTENWIFVIFNPIADSILLIILFLYFRYKKNIKIIV